MEVEWHELVGRKGESAQAHLAVSSLPEQLPCKIMPIEQGINTTINLRTLCEEFAQSHILGVVSWSRSFEHGIMFSLRLVSVKFRYAAGLDHRRTEIDIFQSRRRL